MNRILSAPGKFVLGNGEIGQLARYVESFGSPIVLVAHPDDAARVSDSLAKVEAEGIKLIRSEFGGECTRAEIERAQSACRKNGAKAVAGLGGGKAIDTAKAAAHYEGLPSVIIPTIAATDAPCSKLAVVYNEDHVQVEALVFPKNPDLVLADSGVIAKAPARFLVAGMGDAYATYYEGRACLRSGALNYNKGGNTLTAMAIAAECLRILLEDGEEALLACRAHTVTPALENIIEANVLLSGIGFESAGLSAAHAVHGGFTELAETHGAMHGEKVAVGTLVQLILENGPKEELLQALRFYKTVGLPTNLGAIGITDPAPEKLRRVAARCTKPASIMHNMPFTVTEDMVYDALVYVNSLDMLTM
jgi:glycerol dehydrogenase